MKKTKRQAAGCSPSGSAVSVSEEQNSKPSKSVSNVKTREKKAAGGGASNSGQRHRRKTDKDSAVKAEEVAKSALAAEAVKSVTDQISRTSAHIAEAHINSQTEYDKKVSELTDFYEKKIYDLEQMLDISRSFSREIELGKLLEAIKYMCMAQMHVLSVDIFIRGSMDESDTLTLNNQEGEYKIDIAHPLVKELFRERLAMTAESLLSRVPPSVPTPVINALQPTLIVPIVDKNTLGGIIFLGERISFDDSNTKYSDYERSQVMSIATLAAVAISNASLVEKSSTDMMTRLKLKYYFFNVLNDRLCEAMDRKLPLSVLMFDIDHFKNFNDTYGHECGDFVLINVARLIKQNLRESDLASRYGGEEFTALLDDTGRDEAMMVAERIRSAVEKEDFKFGKESLHVTISGGVATFDYRLNPCIDAKALVDQADKGLYMSKHNGRNGVTYADPALLK